MLVLLQKMALHFQQKTPFVAYRKPGETNVKALLQKNEETFTTHNFTESGFVFAPFSPKENALLIPTSEAESLEAVFEEKKLKGNVLDETDKTVSEDKTGHIDLIKKGIENIGSGKLKKVVLAREVSMEFPEQDPWTIFQRLLENYPMAFVYAWYHPLSGLWMGATPERLLRVGANQLTTMALAGTKKNDGREVIWTEKEKKEQAMVTDFMVEKLRPKLENLKISELKTSAAGNLWHLKTTISGSLRNQNLKEIIEALHPTPAVCGVPRNMAMDFILKNENFDREFYTGFFGELNIETKNERSKNQRNQENKAYFALKKSTDLYVNLRCMKFEKEKAHIFVGGGITKESDPESEWEETNHKLQTMSKVL